MTGKSKMPFSTMSDLNRRQLLGGTAAVGVAAGLGGLALPGAARAAEPKSGGRLRVAIAGGSTTDTLDPANYTDTFMLSVGFATHSTLTEISPEGDLVGDAAEEWEASDDAGVWTFRLRQGATFTDGKPLTADDVIASMNHHRGEESKSAAKANVDPIADLRKIDDRTVAFELHAGNADFPYLMADYHLLLMPNVDGKADWENYIGTAGYTLEEFEPGVRALMKRRSDYWKDGRAHVDEIEIVGIADAAARQNALITGEVDVMNRADLNTVHLLARAPGVRVEEETGFLHYTAPMITTSSPYDNNELRLALKYGIDRQELLDKILLGHGTLATDHPIAPSVPFWADIEQRMYDPDKAKFHLRQAGYENITLDLSASDAAYDGAVDAAVLMKEHLAKADIEVNVVREPNDGYWSNVWMVKPWSQCYWGGRPTCDWMFSTAYAEGANWNDTFWSHERFNELLVQGRSELNPSLRSEIYRDMQQILSDEGGLICWAFANYVYAMADNVQHGENVAANWELDGGRFGERWWLA